MPITDDELAKKREHVESLRQQVAAEQAKRVEREAAAVSDVTAAELDAETAKLQAQLDAAKAANKAAGFTPALGAPKAPTSDKEV